MTNESYLHGLGYIAVVCLLLVALTSITARAGQSDNAEPRANSVAEMDLANRYAINLFSDLKPIDQSTLPKLDVFRKHRLYTTRFEKDGRVWNRLRLGFFPTEKAARKVLDTLRGAFPVAWVTRVAKKEKGTGSQMSEERLARLMEEAKKAMTGGSYRRAVQYYTKILEYPDHKFRQDAQEFLGLARERNGQLAHARAEYEKYLGLYPKGEAADRVRQRLAGLITARAKPKKKLRKAKKREARTDFYGSFSQFYNRYESFTDIGGNIVNQSALSSDMDINIRRRSIAYDTSFVLVAGYDYDFLEDGPGDETSLSQAYIDMLDRGRGISGRIGRQSRSTDGVLGRFDGGVLSYKLLPWLKVNGISGFPTNSSILESYDTNKYFYGLSMDLGTFADHWDFNLYSIRQEDEKIIDRQAVGGEIRYSHRNRSFFSLVDYDISYNELNTIMLVGNLIFPDKTAINTAVNYRKSPFLTTTNAIIGQGVDSLSDLLLTRSEDEIRKLAMDRTSTSRSVTLGITRPLHQKLQVGGELTVSELTGTDASGGVEAMPGTGYEYFYATQLIGSSLIKEGDIAILGLRYSDTTNSDTVSLHLNTRYPVIRAWRINPRIRADYRQIKRNNVEQLKIRPSLRMDYYLKRRMRFEVDGGVDWSPDWISEQTDSSFDFFLTFGYRLYF
jgi:tetratricopeptide (TPR) repeat protein